MRARVLDQWMDEGRYHRLVVYVHRHRITAVKVEARYSTTEPWKTVAEGQP